MPIFTVTMKSNWSAPEKDRLSAAIHAATISMGYPEDDFFQRFITLGPDDFRVSTQYPGLPKPRTEQTLLIEVLLSTGTETSRKKKLALHLVKNLAEEGVDANDIMVFFVETDRSSGSFGGGVFAPPVVFDSQ